MSGRVLIIAGSDSGGGAGIQADIKAVTMLGGYAATTITALTAQNTLGVFGVFPVDPEFIKKQITTVLEDIGADCIKTGMMQSLEVIEAVAFALEKYEKIPLVVDPVMVATSGDSLLDENAIEALKSKLIAKAYLVTPNIPEAEVLSGIKINDVGDMEKCGRKILGLGAEAVLVKGGHGQGDMISDVLVTASGEDIFKSQRINTKNTHGTGCTLASAIACKTARGKTLESAISNARDYVHEAIKRADDLGQGSGPIKHNFSIV